jgi:RNA polymerase sigma-70 factor (ECF subfamily)
VTSATRRDDPDTSVHLQRARTGEHDSVAWIVGRFTPLLLAQARCRLGRLPAGLCEPEDLVQDVWVSSLPRLAGLQARDGRFTPVLVRFLATAVLNRCRTLAQKLLWGKPARQPLPELDDASASGGDGALATDATNVVSRVVRADVADAVRAAIERLDEPDREVLVLRGIEQNANTTVALLLGITPEAVSTRYRRALERLRAHLPRSLFDELD